MVRTAIRSEFCLSATHDNDICPCTVNFTLWSTKVQFSLKTKISCLFFGGKRPIYQNILVLDIMDKVLMSEALQKVKVKKVLRAPEQVTLRKKCPYSELFWSAFSCIRTE